MFSLQKSKNYGNHAQKLFELNKKRSSMEKLNKGANDLYMKNAPHMKDSMSAQRVAYVAKDITFDTPRKGGRYFVTNKSEIDFLLGRDGGKPSALTIDHKRISQERKHS